MTFLINVGLQQRESSFRFRLAHTDGILDEFEPDRPDGMVVSNLT